MARTAPERPARSATATATVAQRWRVVTAGVIFVALAGCVAVRVVLLQTPAERDFLQEQGDARTLREVSVEAARGVIYDRRGEPLAVSTPVASVWIDPKFFEPQHDRLPEMLGLLDVSPRALADRLERYAGQRFFYLRRRVAPGLAAEVAALRVPGVHLRDEYKRYYPAAEVAAHVVGLTDIDDSGIEGLELAYDPWLKGQPGRKQVVRDNAGLVVRDLGPVRREGRTLVAEPGKDLHLALDLRLQYLAYRELKAALARYGARAGSIVVLDARSGEVLAMVNQPAYNPNAPLGGGHRVVRNRAMTDFYEPGSTVKPLTMAAALEADVVQPDTVIDTSPGWIHISGKTIEDPLNRGVLTLEEIIAESSQVGITHIALDLEEAQLQEVFSRFGFGRPTGVGFPGESGGRMPGPPPWPKLDRVTFAFGYGLAVTPLQLAQAYTVFANRGVLVTPTLLRAEAETSPTGERVLSEPLARRLGTMLEAVVREEGTATRAAIPGYRVAGKTGTVRKVGPQGYDEQRHLAYFAGYAPADAPRVTAVVLIDEPRGDHVGGGTVAAPVFSRVVAGALRLLDVAPERDALAAGGDDEDGGAA